MEWVLVEITEDGPNLLGLDRPWLTLGIVENGNGGNFKKFTAPAAEALGRGCSGFVGFRPCRLHQRYRRGRVGVFRRRPESEKRKNLQG